MKIAVISEGGKDGLLVHLEYLKRLQEYLEIENRIEVYVTENIDEMALREVNIPKGCNIQVYNQAFPGKEMFDLVLLLDKLPYLISYSASKKSRKSNKLKSLISEWGQVSKDSHTGIFYERRAETKKNLETYVLITEKSELKLLDVGDMLGIK